MAEPMTGTDTQLNAQWARVRGRLRQEYGEATFRSWLKPLTLAGRRGADLRVSVPSRFMRDWVATHYADRLRTLWSNENPEIHTVEVIVDSTQTAATAQPESAVEEAPETIEAPEATEALSSPAIIRDSEPDTLDEWSGNLDPRLTFENFVVGKANELAQAAAFRVAESDQVPFNPLFLYGGVGLGKTHLMHAIAHQIRKKKPEKRVIYLSAEKFMYQFIRALRNKNTMAF